MMKFLEDLKKELIKMKLSKSEIGEILADHEEMIDQAVKEGLSEEQITAKFGDPAKLARELKQDNPNLINEGEKQMKNGYELFKTFEVMDELKEVEIKLVSEDVEYQLHSEDTIEVYFKNVSNTDEYICEYEDGKFSLSREKKMGINIFRSKERAVIINIPEDSKLDVFKFATVSGDVEAATINAKEFEFNTTSGDLEVQNLIVVNGLVKTVSGDAEIMALQAKTLRLSSVSGDFEIYKGVVEAELDINTVSGDVEVEEFEAGETTFKSVSGDLEGKNFYPKKLHLKSVSGDIQIQNDDKSKVIEVGNKRTVSGDISIN